MNIKRRLDQAMVSRGLTISRSQAESYIKLGQVMVNDITITKTGHPIHPNDTIKLCVSEQYVSRAALKLESVASALELNFKNKIVLDVGSSTGGFTDFALRHGARKAIDVEVGTDQLHPRLQNDPRIELHEKTDVRDFRTNQVIDIVLADVSFISLREILPSIKRLSQYDTQIVVMVKPQFEASRSNLKHKGVIKNDAIRRTILKNFEQWASQDFMIVLKADSQISGAKGNKERFYLLRKLT